MRELELTLTAGSRVGVVGPNGAGKSTLLRLLAGDETPSNPDKASIETHRSATSAFLQQTVDPDAAPTAVDFLFAGEGEAMAALRALNTATDDDAIAKAMARVDDAQAWNVEASAREVLERLGCDWDEMKSVDFKRLSAGQRKRVAIASVLLAQPDILYLDEPTTHLSVEAIEWLENRLVNPPPDAGAPPAILCVSHDRAFLDGVCTSILELDGGGGCFRHAGNYAAFVDAREARWHAALKDQQKAKTLLRKEAEWMRRQPKARETKSVSRQAAFYELEERASGGGAGGAARAAAQQLQSKMDLSAEGIVQSSRLGAKVVDIKDVSLTFGKNNKTILKDFTLNFSRGTRIGVVGENGVGKSTMLAVILGQQAVDEGDVEVGETVRIGHFAQEPTWDDDSLRVCDYVKSFVATADNGGAYAATSLPQLLERFNFTSGRQDVCIADLSGGEQRRLQLMTVLASSPNFLVVDEPTNELDIATIEAFESVLENWEGCVVCVSHDRQFLDTTCDSLVVLEGGGKWRLFPGTYSEWREVEKAEAAAAAAAAVEQASTHAEEPKQSEAVAPALDPATRKRLHNAPKEISKIEQRLEAIELEMGDIDERMNACGADVVRAQEVLAERAPLEAEQAQLYEKWEELELLLATVT